MSGTRSRSLVWRRDIILLDAFDLLFLPEPFVAHSPAAFRATTRQKFVEQTSDGSGPFTSVYSGWTMVCFAVVSIRISPLARAAVVWGFGTPRGRAPPEGLHSCDMKCSEAFDDLNNRMDDDSGHGSGMNTGT